MSTTTSTRATVNTGTGSATAGSTAPAIRTTSGTRSAVPAAAEPAAAAPTNTAPKGTAPTNAAPKRAASKSQAPKGAASKGAAPKRERKNSARTRLLAAADELFYREGMNATGIDTITTHAGVARKSLYNNFANKDEMQLAYVDKRHHDLLTYYHQRLNALISNTDGTNEDSAKPAARDVITAMFDAYMDHAAETLGHGFRGCGVLNAASEVPAGSELRAAVRGYKEAIEDIFAEHVPGTLAKQLSFILEGAMVRSGLEGSLDSLKEGKLLALALVENDLSAITTEVNE